MDTDSSMTRGPATPPVPQRRWRLEAVILASAFVLELFASGVLLGPMTAWGGGGDRVPRWIIIAILLVELGALALRRHRPMTILLVVVVISAGLTLWLEGAQPFFLVPVALFTAASQTSLRRSLAALGLALVHVLVLVWSISIYVPGPATALDVAFPASGFSAVLITVWVVARRDRAHRLRAASLRDELAVEAERAAQAERHRIARELHDIVAHSVSAMMMQAAGARAMTQSVARDLPEDGRVKAVQGALGTIESTGAQSMRELHRLLGALRDGDLASTGNSLDLDHDLSPSAQPDLSDLDELIQVPRRSGLIVEVHQQGTAREVDPSVGSAAYRVVQESLTNALKHAGRGALVDVYVAWQEQDLQVQVRCRGSHDATRPDTPGGGTGLRGLKERVNLVGGTFESGRAGDDFVTTATLPVRPPASGGADGTPRHVGSTGWE